MKIKKPKKKELVELETQLKYYHQIGFFKEKYIKERVTRGEAEKRGYKMCDTGCFNVHTLKENIISVFKGILIYDK